MHTLWRKFKFKPSSETLKILKLLEKKPLSSTEIQKHFKPERRKMIRYRLTRLYRYGHLVRSPFKTKYGYIYSLPQNKEMIVEKLKEIVPPYVRNSLSLILSQKKIFTLNRLVELTEGNFETLEYYLTKVFSKQLNWIKFDYYKGYKIFWSSKFEKEELLKEFIEEMSKKHREIKLKGEEFEKEVIELLDDYLLNLPFKVVRSSEGTPSGKYFDVCYKLFLFDDIQPVHLKVEIKSYIPNLYQVAQFYRKIREFKHGCIIPVLIAPAFPSIVYRTFGDMIYLVPFRRLKERLKVILSTRVTQ